MLSKSVDGFEQAVAFGGAGVGELGIGNWELGIGNWARVCRWLG